MPLEDWPTVYRLRHRQPKSHRMVEREQALWSGRSTPSTTPGPLSVRVLIVSRISSLRCFTPVSARTASPPAFTTEGLDCLRAQTLIKSTNLSLFVCPLSGASTLFVTECYSIFNPSACPTAQPTVSRFRHRQSGRRALQLFLNYS